jgi:hypothetical protein
VADSEDVQSLLKRYPLCLLSEADSGGDLAAGVAGVSEIEAAFEDVGEGAPSEETGEGFEGEEGLEGEKVGFGEGVVVGLEEVAMTLVVDTGKTI